MTLVELEMGNMDRRFDGWNEEWRTWMVVAHTIRIGDGMYGQEWEIYHGFLKWWWQGQKLGGTIPFTNYFTLERETKFEKTLSAMEIK